ncbi:MAG: hypothetical protein BAJATHORv1_10431 [Candidatus Thorarchaeota archaeon]|nr:MAG: hypothetical protein BAJATHORv1_10431 [Candidatus Thorarchaeota archaeon]
MSTRERSRKTEEKTKSKTVEKKSDSSEKSKSKQSESLRSSRPTEIEKLTSISSSETQQAISEETTEVDQALEILLPIWGDRNESEWMYHVPERKEDRGMWAQEWADFLLEWTQNKVVHVISVTMFIKEAPFNDILGKSDAFKMIGDALVDKEMADWTSRKKRQLRVYWRPLEEWADIIYQWALDTGHTRLDVKSIMIQEADQDFASLPEKDLHIVIELMVEKELAEWVDKKRGAIKVNII